MMTRILFVTNELYPYAKGGIGRLIYNYITWNRTQRDPAQIHVLLLTDKSLEDQRWGSERLDGATVHIGYEKAGIRPEQHLRIESLPPALKEPVRSSTIAANAIEHLYEIDGLQFDYIEFPDFMGLAYESQNRKIIGEEAFTKSRLVVRLHSSISLIQEDEGEFHDPSTWFSAVTDMERISLARADLVVGHLDSIVERNKRYFGFDDEWLGRTYVEFPPILLTETEMEEARTTQLGVSPAGDDGRIFVFSSRLQPFKRPDLFIRGGAAYLRKFPDSADQFVLMSYGWDADYLHWLRSLIPYDLSDRIRLVTKYTPAERARILAKSCIVLPSTFESLCIFAYETYLLGRTVILNGDCSAFSQSPFWRDGENCLLFDGSPEGLASAIEISGDFKPNFQMALPEVQPYWTLEPIENAGTSTPPRLDVIYTDVITASSPETEEASLGAFASAGLIASHTTFIDNLYGAPKGASPGPAGATIRIPVFGAYPHKAALKRALAAGSGEFVLFCASDATPSREWLDRISVTLRNIPGDGVAFVTTDSKGKSFVPLLDCPNVISAGFQSPLQPVVLRRSLVERMLNDELYTEAPLTTIGLDAVFAGALINVVGLEFNAGSSERTIHYPRFRYIADRMMKARRRTSPHVSAFNIDFTKLIGSHDHDEWRVLDYPVQVEQDAPYRSSLGVHLSLTSLTVDAASFESASARLMLQSVSFQGEDLGDLAVQFSLQDGILRLWVKPLDVSSPLPAVEASRMGIITTATDTRSFLDLGADVLFCVSAVLKTLLERLPIWYYELFARSKRSSSPDLEEILRREIARVDRAIIQLIDLSTVHRRANVAMVHPQTAAETIGEENK